MAQIKFNLALDPLSAKVGGVNSCPESVCICGHYVRGNSQGEKGGLIQKFHLVSELIMKKSDTKLGTGVPGCLLDAEVVAARTLRAYGRDMKLGYQLLGHWRLLRTRISRDINCWPLLSGESKLKREVLSEKIFGSLIPLPKLNFNFVPLNTPVESGRNR